MTNIQKIQDHYGVHLLTSEIPSNMEVTACFGMVHGQAIQGANFIKDFFAKVSDVTGGRVSGYEKSLQQASFQCIEMMTRRAAELGANAIVAVDLRTSAMGPRMLMAACCGTAYILRERSSSSTPPVGADGQPTKYLHNYNLG
jgi:uncharacterized protein YbjQ (UPF0145 family)